MKLKTKLPLFTSFTALISIVSIAAFSIYNFRQKTIENIEAYRIEQTEQTKIQLKDIVNISYRMIEQSYYNSKSENIKQKYGLEVNDTSEVAIKMIAVNVLKITVENIRVLRYGTDGYIWINDINPPYRVIMHAIKPELEGTGHVFYIENSDKNVYEAFADICNNRGEGFLKYDFYKASSKERLPKLSYIKLFEPLGWVIGTGVYIDYIDKVVAKKTLELKDQINMMIMNLLLIGLFLITITSAILYLLSSTITSAIHKIRDQLYDLAKGRMVEKMNLNRKDEIGEIEKSLNALIEGLSTYSTFAIQIGKGNFDIQFRTLSKEDKLGNSLIEMRNSLQKAKIEEEVRKEENAKRAWATEGQAKFGEILRVYGKDEKELAYNIISNLIRYLGANQGGLFTYNDDNPKDLHLELIASFAYDRRKYFQKKVKVGDGLIGACAIEKEVIYMTRIPEDYILIRSGIGGASPTSLLIVPLKLKEDIFGVIEIASFNTLEPYHIDFIEKITESIASSLFAVKMNQRTSRLLEEFKIQAEEKAAQEIEMLQNIEEIRLLREKVKSLESESTMFGLL